MQMGSQWVRAHTAKEEKERGNGPKCKENERMCFSSAHVCASTKPGLDEGRPTCTLALQQLQRDFRPFASSQNRLSSKQRSVHMQPGPERDRMAIVTSYTLADEV